AIDAEMQRLSEGLKEYAGDFIYGHNDETLESVVGELLLARHYSIGCAESCTGGYVSHRLTRIPGSSRYFKGAVVAYANEIKELVGVRHASLGKWGAVSEAVVREMAEGIRKHLKTDIGIATTGIAGPTGGTTEKPVGTVWIACSDGKRTVARKLQLSGDRLTNIRLSATHALNLVRRFLLGAVSDQ